ncbi:hypothetical protein [Blautia sp. MSJ-19]|uniref:hypothetical protein n=1 Tax=Blautia sp. MSJ-19 TaxID=2841517 RepID=UPI001C0EF375|nr:hypothetical protein [Blautia sp. MSJ-19]MBU5480378.1 hypothetical protein [Blautia sp. MSJ-19]
MQELLHPSLLQITYLIALEKTEKKRGCVGRVADICGVSHGPVSRFFKECVICGYLTEQYEFTEPGICALKMYKRLLHDTRDYLARLGISEEEMPKRLRQLVENVDYELLMSITRSDIKVKKDTTNIQTEESTAWFLEKVLEKGNYEVEIALLQVNRNAKTRLSMAHYGFEHLAMIRHNNRGSWIELTICPVHGISRIDGKDMTGWLSSLKYEKQGQLYEVDLRTDKVRIPLSACRFIKSSHGNIKGMIMITVTCSAGKAHMPESTALLMFWL